MEKSKKTLAELFNKYTPKNDWQRDILSRSLSLKTRVDKEKKLVETEASFPFVVKVFDLWTLCEDIKSVYALNYLRIRPKYTPEMFNNSAMNEVLEEAAMRGAIIRGFFHEYNIQRDGDKLTIHLSTTNGGVELVCTSDAPEIISNIIFEEFSLRFKVEILREEFYSDEEFFARRDAQLLREASMHSEKIANMPKIQPKTQNYGKGEGGYRKSGLSAPDKKILLEDIAERITTLSDEPALEENEGDIYKLGKMTFDVSGSEILWGDDFEFFPIPLRDIKHERKDACLFGEIFGLETRQTRKKDKTIVSFYITDNDGAFTVKCILSSEGAEQLTSNLKDGVVCAVSGQIKLDEYDGELVLTLKGFKKIKKVGRKDKAEEKRVELHVHTQMSMLDATIPPDELVKTAYAWGHRAVALTDHGNVQGFPDAMIAVEKINKGLPEGKEPFKVIYGMEAYFVDDTSSIMYGSVSKSMDEEFVVFDIETTGKSPITCGITEIGAVKIKNGEVLSKFNTFVNPGMPIPEFITNLTGISDDMVADAPNQAEAVKQFLEYANGKTLIAHNAAFDTGFIKRVCTVNEMEFSNPYIDTLALSRYVNTDLKRHTLDRIAKYFNLEEFNHHRACDDAYILALIFFKMIEKLKQEGIDDFDTLQESAASSGTAYKQRPYHMVILAKNNTGLKNLYKLISYSYLKYYYRHPLIPKTVLNEHREGLIISSACCSGELYKAILDGKSDDELAEIVDYYDYLEIQPLMNNSFMLALEDSAVKNEDDLIAVNKRIIELGEKHGKPVCATTDAHVLNKEDEIGRKIILAGKKMKDGDSDIGLYLRTTEEMYDEFYYLDDEAKKKVIIDNPNKIADMIEQIRPIPKGNYPPKIPGADEELTQMCYDTMHEMYGENPPEIVEKRLERELTSIIKNGFGVLYIIAQKLVKNSNDKGYLVGSRGSVGSSFVATMANITEVNPLPPHYRCKNCKYSDFDVPENIGSGFDLEDKICPKCGNMMSGDGHDIPFETFLGFDGDKSPDIDLNFSGDVQADAHKYTEVLFGEENVFRAGTLGTLAAKTAYGLYVMKYIEEKQLKVTKPQIQYLVGKCIGVKRTTGQHPGGIIVVPRENEVYDFTPVQHPADDAKSDIVTTHFAFEYLHDTILKLDILGHDVPTKYKKLEEYTNTSVLDAPMNDKKVYDLLLSTKSLGITEADIGSPVGTFGLPELGTKFVRQMLIDTQPKCFSDLLQISGLSHGTDVWLGNAQTLIKEGTCTISEVIGTRDNIMVYLLHKGLEPKMAFTIMEIVRKGNRPPKNLKDEHFAAMREHGVPEWYIESCLKIKYMFPKAHAAAYIISAIRLGWYKVYYPMEFYAAYFTAAPGGFDATIVLAGKEALRALIKEIEEKPESSQKDAEQYTASQLALEALCRGVEFLPVDLKKSDAHAFLPENGKIRIPFAALPNLGDAAAESLAAACRETEIFSIEDLRKNAKLSKTVIEILRENGVLDSLSETNQMSMFG